MSDKVSIYGGKVDVKLTPQDGQLLIGDGSSFDLATLTAGANISVVNTPGGIEIGATGLTTGTVTSVGLTSTGTGFTVSGSPVTSSGTIDLAGTLNPTHGGTGLSDPTANSLLVANGASNMTLVAPGASGNVLTSNGTAWVSAVPNYSPALLQTIATTSGTTITSNTIPTTYRKLIIYVKALRHNGGTTLYNLLINASINDGSSWLTSVTLNPALNGSTDLYLYIDMPNYSEANMIKVGSASGSGLTNFVFSITSAISGQINKLKFSWSVGTVAFTAGSIVIYGQY